LEWFRLGYNFHNAETKLKTSGIRTSRLQKEAQGSARNQKDREEKEVARLPYQTIGMRAFTFCLYSM
jgi:hypothetical protein